MTRNEARLMGIEMEQMTPWKKGGAPAWWKSRLSWVEYLRTECARVNESKDHYAEVRHDDENRKRVALFVGISPEFQIKLMRLNRGQGWGLD